MLNIPGKVFAKILGSRVCRVTESEVMDRKQALEWVEGGSDLIFMLNKLMEK